MAMVEQMARLFEYEARCTDLVAGSLRAAQVGVEELGLASLAAPLERAVAVYCHMQAARRLWLYRVDPTRTGVPDDGLFPIWPLKKAVEEAREMDGLWGAFLGGVDEAALSRAVVYQSTDGTGFESSLADILTHVVNHSTYHRGQIASLVAATGTKPVVTDYIALTRRAI